MEQEPCQVEIRFIGRASSGWHRMANAYSSPAEALKSINAMVDYYNFTQAHLQTGKKNTAHYLPNNVVNVTQNDPGNRYHPTKEFCVFRISPLNELELLDWKREHEPIVEQGTLL